MRRIALLGLGAIGRSIANQLLQTAPPDLILAGLCTRASQLATATAEFGDATSVCASVADLLALSPDVVIEAAGHEAIAQYGAALLRAGVDVYVLSTGALADDRLLASLVHAAQAGGAKLVIPSGAFAGFDGIRSLNEAGIEEITYTSTKPPRAWSGTPAEQLCDLEHLRVSTTFFEGTARQAALRFPKNANLAAAVAIAGVGLDKTRVRLVADPNATVNIGSVLARGDAGDLEVTLSGAGFEANPKTSEITGMSVLAALRNDAAVLRFG
jgi:aspartate dehydrogenase